MLPKPPTCAGCPAAEVGLGYVPGAGPPRATVALVGQGPGIHEAHAGQPFVGDSGTRLDTWLARAGHSRSQLWIDNVVRCQLPKNRPPKPTEAAHCWAAHGGPALDGRFPTVVVPVGVPAIRTVLSDPEANETYAGTVTKQGSRYVVPILHPAYILRGQWGLEPAQIKYLATVREIATTGYTPTVDPATPPVGTTIGPTLSQVLEYLAHPNNSGGVAVDIEAAGPHLMCIGLCRVRDLEGIVVPFRTEGTTQYWSLAELRTLVEHLVRWFADPSVPKVFHNGQGFDVPYLENLGFKVAGYSFDTMLAQHVLYPEMPKRLEFIATLYLGYPRWKHLKSDAGEAK